MGKPTCAAEGCAAQAVQRRKAMLYLTVAGQRLNLPEIRGWAWWCQKHDPGRRIQGQSAAPAAGPAQPTRPLSKLQERILAALHTRATQTPAGLRVQVSPRELGKGLAIGAETAARGLASLEKAGRIRRFRGQAVVPVRGYAREDFDQEITLVEDASTASEPTSAEADPLQRLLELGACWRRASGLPAGVPPPTGPVDPATLKFCGAVVGRSLLAVGGQGDGDEDALTSLQELVNLADLWTAGQGGPPSGGESPPISLDPDTLRYCGRLTREGVFDVLQGLIRELKEEEAQFTVRGFALYLWRVWSLVTTLRQEPPPMVALNDLWMHIDRQLKQTADRLLRAAARTGRCAVQEGCGRPHETVAAAPPDPGAFQALIAALAALGAAWQDGPPASHRAAGDELAALLRAHRMLHDQAAPGLCAVCRPIFLGFLASATEGA